MSNQKESKFHAKLIYFIVFVLFFKLVYVIITSIIYGSLMDFIWAFIILVVVFFVTSVLINALFDNSSKGSFGGGSSTVGESQFQTLMNRYEKLCDDFIEKKQYKKAAYIQMKLLRNPYRAANILKEGHLYNEAARVYLKRCHSKEDAAECYEMARSYTKSIKLYSELEMNEKVGDIYTKLKDTKKAQHHYQIVVDDYKLNYQYVKAALICRKKMNDTNTANELLIKGWKDQKDPVNCANNFFANYNNQASLQTVLANFKKEMVNNRNEYNFLKVLKLEYNRDIAPKEDIQEMAYELISKNNNNSEVLSLLKHFVNDDSQLQTDMIRHRRSIVKKFTR
ncbi:hypothetical protein U8527_15105 [Kordia algicida OT-1]|uniref:Uncharacterized protein n=1 Tax=Kordia algicida OT-1 TaxID=391587 RepID=A9E788_9FLAO|nr:hypothetical protein [Kordia algicida]EDP94881.1 hypothetical protein KAOT1_08709 [Kordia algicida OT-1]